MWLCPCFLFLAVGLASCSLLLRFLLCLCILVCLSLVLSCVQPLFGLIVAIIFIGGVLILFTYVFALRRERTWVEAGLGQNCFTVCRIFAISAFLVSEVNSVSIFGGWVTQPSLGLASMAGHTLVLLTLLFFLYGGALSAILKENKVGGHFC